MPKRDKVLAWLEPRSCGCLAAFVGGGAPDRQPAARIFPTPEDARDWVEREAAALRAPVEWVLQEEGRPKHRR